MFWEFGVNSVFPQRPVIDGPFFFAPLHFVVFKRGNCFFLR